MVSIGHGEPQFGLFPPIVPPDPDPDPGEPGQYDYLAPIYDLPAGMTYNPDTGFVVGTVMDTTYDPPSTTVTLTDQGSRSANAAALASAITTAAAGGTGTRIRLAAGADYGGNYSLPANNSTGWIYIESDALAEMPAGTRVTPDDLEHMPLMYMTAVNTPVFTFGDPTATGRSRYRFVGLAFTFAPSGVSWNTIAQTVDNSAGGFVSSTLNREDAAEMVSDIVVDRCYFHGGPLDANRNCRRFVFLNGSYIAMIDSFLEDSFWRGSDGQCFLATCGAGPYKVVNNYLAAAAQGENIMFGGSSNHIVCSDIELQRNHFDMPRRYHDAIVDGVLGGQKNLFETKQGIRLLMQGNLFTNYRSDAIGSQFFPIGLKSSDDSGGDWPNTDTRDVTWRLNELRDCGGTSYYFSWIRGFGIQFDGCDLTCNRQLIPSYVSGTQRSFSMQFNLITRLRLLHNTFWAHTAEAGEYATAILDTSGPSEPLEGYQILDNIFAIADFMYANYWFAVDSGSNGLTGWESVADEDCVFEHNVVTRTTSLPANNTSIASIATAELEGARLELGEESPCLGVAREGRDPGAVHSLIDAALVGVEHEYDYDPPE